MHIDFSLEEAVKKRYSVRNYEDREIEADKTKALESFVASLSNPFGNKVNFHYLDVTDPKEMKLGTYGVIKGAKKYIGTTILLEPLALEALGYEFEAVVLFLAYLGLGTCWLGGTFHRKGFANAMNIGQNEVFPIIAPYGYAAARRHMQETIMRKMARSDQRRKWAELFYVNDLHTPLSEDKAGELGFPLAMVRLGPSASNKQPWRLLLKDNCCHFFEYKEPGYSKIFPYDIQRIDMGIAAAHFDFAVKEKAIRGHFDPSCKPDVKTPDNVEYVFTWKRD